VVGLFVVFAAAAFSPAQPPASPSSAAPNRSISIRVVEEGRTQDVELYKESHALLIGVSDYTAGWPPLSGVKKDVVDVRAVLERQGFQVEVVENPTAVQLRSAYETFIQRHGAKTEARLLLYFSGHGHTLKLAWGGDMGYIIPADAPNPNRDLEGFKDKAVDMQQIEVYAKRIEAKHALFIFDSCFSGSIFDMTRAVPENITLKTTRPVRQFITSGGADQTVPNESIFRGQFVEALDGEADSNRDGYVTGAELGEFLQEKVTNYSRGAQEPQYGKIRNPLLDKGDFVFTVGSAQRPGQSAPAPAVPLEIPSFDTEDMEKAAEARRKAEESRRQFCERARSALAALIQKDGDEFITAQEKAAKYKEFLDAFRGRDEECDARLSTEFARAEERLNHWRTWKPAPTPRPTPAPPPATAPPAAGRTENEYEQGGRRYRKVDLGGGVTMNLVYIRGGTFTMGSPDSEDGRYSDEGPQTRVTLTEDFWMGETEVTQAQWKAVMGSGNNPSNWKSDNLPVGSISWNDAMEFCKKLTEHGSAGVSPATRGPDGRAPLRFTLPTEAQWEYACRANPSKTTRYSFGDSDSSLGDYAWYDKNSGGKTQPVKTKKPNAWGLYDMHGNVWEWCSDWFSDKLPGGSVTNPTGPSSGSYRVHRGGSWDNGPRICRSAIRDINSPGSRNNNLGFRAVAVVQ
jgi:formylglycine-generating enzyme required for sulfatase activity